MALNLKKRSSDDLKFPEFEDIKVSTKTFIAMTNITIDLKKLFDYLPITNYKVLPKKRGRKKKFEQVEEKIIIETGSIITLKFENDIRGVEIKKKKLDNKKKKSKWFRNSFTVIMIIDNKPINFKICQNGMIQVTGCKFDSQAEECVKFIWYYIKEQKDIYKFTKEGDDVFQILFIPVMRNIDFSVGFLVDREKLARYMSTQTQFHSLLETSFGYTGVNVKVPILTDIREMVITKLHFKDEKWVSSLTTYNEYLSRLSEKEINKKLNKERFVTFLVFHSGKVIQSGINASLSRDSYYYFLKIIRTAFDEIEERLDV
jgi:TATA-box binding protein (TBP) (component of TFIID and TFIIIB)